MEEKRIPEYTTIYRDGVGEIVEKKSRFIASIAHVETEEEALAFIEGIKKKYWDARHNCHAYVIGTRGDLVRFNDDKEPGGTAGKPMLDVLLGKGICNVVVVVTRYFGGVLLGTGGLVRAYSGAVEEGLRNCTVITKKLAYILTIGVDYTDFGKVQYYLANEGYTPSNVEYGLDVTVTVPIPVTAFEQVVKQVTEVTNGRARQEKNGEVYCAEVDKTMILFES